MPINVRRKRSARALQAIVPSLLICLMLAACGSSSSSSPTATTAAGAKAGAPAGSPAGKAPGGANLTALRECLAKHGITLPTRTPGSTPPGGTGTGAPPSGAAPQTQLPKGVSKAQQQEAFAKCGAGQFGAGAAGAPAGGGASSAAFTKFASCMKENGVNLPAANTSGNGPVFNTKGIDTTSASFKAAQSKCQKDLGGAIPSGGQGGAPQGGAPPSAG